MDCSPPENPACDDRHAPEAACPIRSCPFAAASPDWEFWRAPDGSLRYVSDACERISGYPPTSFLADPDLLPSAFHPADRAAFHRALAQAAPAGECDREVELRLTTATGEPRWVGLVVSALPDGSRRGALRDITARKHAEDADREAHLFADALHEVSRLVNSTLSLDEVFRHTLTQVRRVLEHDAANLMLIEDGVARVMSCHGAATRGRFTDIMNVTLPVETTANLKYMAQTGQAICMPDVTQNPAWVTKPGTEWVRSYAAAPICVKGQTLGFINLDSAIPNFFQPEQLDRLMAFAQQVGVAVENARLFEEVLHYARRSTLLNDITLAAMSAPSLENLLQRLTDRVAEMFSADGVLINLWDGDGQRPVAAAAFGLMREQLTQLAFTPGERTLTAAALEAREPLVVADLTAATELSPQLASRWPVTTVLALPLISAGQKLGAVLVGFRTRRHFDSESLNLGKQAANQIALALSRNQSLTAERQRAQELARSNRLIAALSATAALLETTDDPARILEVLGDELRQLNLTTIAALRDGPQDPLTVRYFSAPPEVQARVNQILDGPVIGYALPSDSALVQRVVVERQPFFEVGLHPATHSAFPQRAPEVLESALMLAGIDAATPYMYLPLTVKERGIGLLVLWGPDLQASDLTAVSIFARQVATALDNARLYLQVQQLALTDDLTGLLNRRGLFTLGQHEVDRARRRADPLACLMVDIDHFKRVNDAYGHLVGDEILRALAARLAASVREIDVVARYGGEEFVLLLVESSPHAAAEVAQRVRLAVACHPFVSRAGDIPITVSLGLVNLTPACTDLSGLIARADQALYAAKRAGRNCIIPYESIKEAI